jgi:ArsR family transcriptional regulator
LKALADPTRLGLLDLLAQQTTPLCVCDITPRFAQNQPTISHHLKLLRAAGLIDCEKRGVWAFYWATAAGAQWLARVKSAQTGVEA